MAYLSLLLSVFCSALKGYSSKKVSGYILNVYKNVLFNVARTVICLIISFLVVIFSGKLGSLKIDYLSLFICGISGIATALFQISWMASVKNGAYMTVSAFGNASFIVPCILGVVLLKEPFSMKTCLAFVLIIAAVFIMYRYNNKIKIALGPKLIALLIAVSLTQGISQFMQKAYMITSQSADSRIFSFYTFTFSFAGMAVYLLISALKGTEKGKGQKQGDCAQLVKYLVLMSVGLYGATYFQTLAAKSFDAVVLYPVITALCFIAGMIMSVLFFKERITKESIAGTALAFIAICLIH